VSISPRSTRLAQCKGRTLRDSWPNRCLDGLLVNELQVGLASGAETTAIGPLSISRLRVQEAIQLIRSAVVTRKPLDIAICNAHTLLLAFDNPHYASVLQKMTLLNDGAGADLASLVLSGRPFADNLNGTDLVPAVLEQVGLSLRIYLIGAREEQAQQTRAHIAKMYPHHTVVGVRNGYFEEADVPRICADISAARPDLLLVAMGNPLQEEFIVRHRDQLNVGVAIGVGALFDFLSGSAVRAPKALRVLRLEWLFRLIREPQRLGHRYLIGGPRFLIHVMKLRFSSGHVNGRK